MEEKELGLAIMLIYQMWLARNEAREVVQIVAPQDIVRRSLALLEEWVSMHRKPEHTSSKVREQWSPSEEGWIKANIDGAFSSDSGCGGCGVVLRDHHGGFRGGATQFFTHVNDPERAELLACKHALLLAKEKGFDRLCVESDCLGAMAKIWSAEVNRSSHGPLVEEIKEMMKDFAGLSVRHVRRTANGVAHLLAKFGCENKLCKVWVNPPDLVVSTLALECA
jgi:ribonuclease HI